MAETGMLVLLTGPEEGTVFKLGKRSLSIGRDKGNLVQLISNGISRRHVMIQWTPAGYKVTDLNSTNGTMINQSKVESAVLSLGDVLQIGEIQIKFVPDEPDARDATYARPKVAHGRMHHATESLDPVDGVIEEEPPEEGPEDTGPDYNKIVSVDRRRRRDTSEFEFSIVQLTMDDNYFGLAMEIISDHIAPDRVLILRKKAARKLKVLASHHRPTLRPEERRVAPCVKVLNQAINESRSILDNYIPVPGREGPSVGTAAAVCIEDQQGLIYIDSFNHQKKFFLGSDIKMLETISEAISDSLRG